MKVNGKLYWIFWLIFIIFLSGCAEKKEIKKDIDFKIQANGVSLTIPKNFKWVKGKKEWDLFKFEEANLNLEILLKVNWNKDLKYFPEEMALDIYFSNIRAINSESSIYLLESLKFPMLNGYNAFFFKAADINDFFQGIYFVCNNREYILQLKTKQDNKDKEEFKTAWSLISKSFKVSVLPDHKEYLSEMVKSEENISSYSIKEMLDYGEQLMSSKEDYVKNYPKAISEFRHALSIMEHLSERPFYNRALRLISICKILQKKAYDEHDLLFVKAIHLSDFESAIKEAKIIIELLSDDKQNPLAKAAISRLKFAEANVKNKKGRSK